MKTLDELAALTPPAGLAGEDLAEWWRAQLSEPDGSVVLDDSLFAGVSEVATDASPP